MIPHEGIVLILLLLLLRSESFINNFRINLSPKASSFKLLAAGSEDLNVRDERFLKGLKLWNKYFDSLEQWEIVKPSNTAFEVAMLLNLGSLMSIIKRFERDSWLLLVFPMIPDLVVEKIVSRKAEGIILEDKEIVRVVNFFLRHRSYRQLASLIALNHQITADHFTQPSLNDLIFTLDNLFQLKPERIESFVGEIGTDKLFLVGPLIACIESDQEIVKKLLKKFLKVSRAQLIAQVCSGIMFTNYTAENENVLFERNEFLINFLSEALINPSAQISILIKACRVMNLIKLNYQNVQRIMMEIYMDESEESVEMLFAILSKVAAKSPFHSKLIDTYRI